LILWVKKMLFKKWENLDFPLFLDICGSLLKNMNFLKINTLGKILKIGCFVNLLKIVNYISKKEVRNFKAEFCR
jgi:hypothetical protein